MAAVFAEVAIGDDADQLAIADDRKTMKSSGLHLVRSAD
jgi:hypothetical protein